MTEIVSSFTFDPKDSIQKVGSVRQEMRQLKEQLLSIPQDDPRWPNVFKRYTELQNHVRELNRLSKASDPHEQVKNYLKLGEAGVGAFTAIRGAAVLFGGASEDTLKQIAQVEAAMSVLQGLKSFNEGILTAKEMFKTLSLTNKATKIAQTETKVLGETQVAAAEATEGATVASKGLGLALKGIGIGLIIAAIAYLIDNWKELKKQFQSLLPHVDGMSSSFNTFKQIAVGVGSVILNIVVTPIKLLISGIKTLIQLFVDIKDGHFGKIFDDIGQGIKDQVAIVKDGFDIIKNFKDGEAASAKAQAEDRRKEELKKEIEHLDDIIAIKKEKGQETYQLELKQLNDKKELYADDEKELKKVNHEIEILMIQHHKKLEEEAKKAAEKAAELAKKEAEREEKIHTDHLKRQLEIAEKDREAREKAAEELLKERTDFLKKGEELDEENAIKKLARLNVEFAKLKAETIAAHGDLIAIEVSYDKQKRQLEKDIADQLEKEEDKKNKELINNTVKTDRIILESEKSNDLQKIAALRDSISKLKALVASGTLSEKEAAAVRQELTKEDIQLDKLIVQSRKLAVGEIAGALNALSGVVNKKSAEHKAIAIGQALINSYQGFTAALASGPPPFNIIEASAVLAAGLANVKKIISTKVGAGDSGGSPSISGTGGAGLAFNAPAIPQATPTTNLSQQSINSITSANPQQSQVVVSESEITGVQTRVSQYSHSGTI